MAVAAGIVRLVRVVRVDKIDHDVTHQAVEVNRDRVSVPGRETTVGLLATSITAAPPEIRIGEQMRVRHAPLIALAEVRNVASIGKGMARLVHGISAVMGIVRQGLVAAPSPTGMAPKVVEIVEMARIGVEVFPRGPTVRHARSVETAMASGLNEPSFEDARRPVTVARIGDRVLMSVRPFVPAPTEIQMAGRAEIALSVAASALHSAAIPASEQSDAISSRVSREMV